MRRDVHAAFAYVATYEDDTVIVPVPITVRWHDKTERVGNINGGDYAEILSTIEHLLFNSEEIDTKGITLVRGGLIKLTEFGDYELQLDALDPPDGPIKIVWSVVRP